jgi:hypothetical protein
VYITRVTIPYIQLLKLAMLMGKHYLNR